MKPERFTQIYRDELSLSKTKLAQALGISTESIRNYEGKPDKDVPPYIALAVTALRHNLPPE